MLHRVYWMGICVGESYAKGLLTTLWLHSLLLSLLPCHQESGLGLSLPRRSGGTIDPFIFQKNKAGLRATERRRTMANSDEEAIAKRCIHLRPDALADPALVSLHLLPCEVGLTRPPPWGASSAPSHPSASVPTHWKRRFETSTVCVARKVGVLPASWDSW